jgi:hypothetical protein
VVGPDDERKPSVGVRDPGFSGKLLVVGVHHYEWLGGCVKFGIDSDSDITTSASKSSSGGLSMGTTIGLAVGFTAGFIGILIYLLNFLYKRRKAKANPYTAKSAPEGGADEHLPEVHTYEPVSIEGDAKPVELEVKPAEMDGTSTCAELPAEKRLLRVEDFDELVVSPRK